MYESPKPFSTTAQTAHVVGYAGFAGTAVSLGGTIATALHGGPVHAAFVVGTVGSLTALLTGLFVHGHDAARCRRCMGKTVPNRLSAVAPVPAESAAVPKLDATGTAPADAWWAV